MSDGEPIILGLDPATRATGWAVVWGDIVRAADVYRTPGSMTSQRLEQLAAIDGWIRFTCKNWRPDVVAVESVHHGPNAQTTLRLAEVGAVVALAAHKLGIPVITVSPAERLRALSLPIMAEKAAVVRAVNLLFGLELEDHNAADAVAIAVAGAGIVKEKEMRVRYGVP